MDGTGDLYRPLIAALGDEWQTTVRIYLPDAVLSYKQHLLELQNIAIDSPFVLIAESYSTPIAIAYAATQPANLKGLVLCAGFASSPLRGWRAALAKFTRHFLFYAPIPHFAIERFLLGANPSKALRQDVRNAVHRAEPRVLSSRLGDLLNCDVRAELKEIAVPILYLQAADDRLVSGACAEDILSENPRVQLEKIPGPHLLFQREPQRCAQVIEQFMRTLL
jgi:pimeloyl-[acyl-carrier protein] methyl ester esterase